MLLCGCLGPELRSSGLCGHPLSHLSAVNQILVESVLFYMKWVQQSLGGAQGQGKGRDLGIAPTVWSCCVGVGQLHEPLWLEVLCEE